MNPRELVRWLQLRWRGLFQRNHQEGAMDREMQFHFDMLVAENVAAGLNPADARLAALREFGDTAIYREECRDTWRSSLITGLLGDFAFALRSLRRSPGFTTVAVLTLALGIGVNAVVFSFVRDSVLRPLLEDRRLNLVSLYNNRVGPERHFRYFSYPEFLALQESTEVFAGVAALGLQSPAIGTENNLQRRFVGFVSENYFSLQNVRPAQGRFFTAEESRPGASIPVVVANHALWERLGRPADFVGSTLRIDDRSYTVIGITPPGFVGLQVSIGPDAWVPLGEAGHLAGADLPKHTETRFTLFARLQPGLSRETIGDRLEPADQRLNAIPPIDRSGARRIVVEKPARADIGNSSPETNTPLALFGVLALGLSLMVLLVACLNLANMFLARGVARQKEIAIRLALGASRWRVVRGLLAEGLLLALLAGAFSLVLGQASSTVLTDWANEAFAAGKFALKVTPFLDPSLVIVTLGFSLFATLAFSLWPALRVTRAELFPDLKQVAGGPVPKGRRAGLFALGDIPLVAQIALSLALLFSAVLFVRGAQNARSLDLGFQPARLVAAQLDYKLAKVDPKDIPRRQQALLASTASLPGVTAAALASNVPYNFDLSHRPVRAAEGSAPARTDPMKARFWSGHTAVTRGYLSTLGIALLRGRDFTAEESNGSGGRPVAIIDESLGQALFGDADPLGREVILDDTGPNPVPMEVVGVMRSPRNEVFDRAAPRRIYRPLGQAPATNVYLHVQVPKPEAFLAVLRSHLQGASPETPVLLLRPFADFVDKNINVLLVKMASALFGIFGGIALVLAAVGVFGVKAHGVAQRTREIGIRLALGAHPRGVMAMILKQGALKAAVGIVFGLGLALAAGRGLSAMLYRVDPADPLALAASAVILAVVVLFACWLPARRATKVDPLVAIRTE
ncbi:MAG TPA: ADOP family duplicated permease [Lacunisphaera sp.]|nr:ADOP family duplicated permease [Lacunisphaera sp.]